MPGKLNVLPIAVCYFALGLVSLKCGGPQVPKLSVAQRLAAEELAIRAGCQEWRLKGKPDAASYPELELLCEAFDRTEADGGAQ